MPADGRIASNRRTQVGQREKWAKREALALALVGRQHGVITHTQLRSLGFSAGALRHRVGAGRLHSVHRGVYALGRSDLPVEGRWMAAVLACGPGALLSHSSAAALHGLLSTARASVDVTISRRVGLTRSGIAVHRSTKLGLADRAEVSGIPCTSVPRTLLDLATVASRPALERACDQAEVRRLIDWEAMEELLARARGRGGVGSLRAVLGATDAGQGLTRSELERRFVALCRDAALPSPAVNQWLTVAGEEMQVDFVWRGPRVVVETDGFRTHGTRQAFQRDRRRDRLLALEGWRVIRFSWNDVVNVPDHVTRVLRGLVTSPFS
jgi:very-short-patch-repair endonuclease